MELVAESNLCVDLVNGYLLDIIYGFMYVGIELSER